MIPFYVRLFVYFETVDGDAGTASLSPAGAAAGSGRRVGPIVRLRHRLRAQTRDGSAPQAPPRRRAVLRRAILSPALLLHALACCRADRSLLMRVAESLVSFRLLKVCRYYEGAQLLTRACVQAAGQLLVPLFMLLILVYNFSSLLFEVEWEQDRPAAAG